MFPSNYFLCLLTRHTETRVGVGQRSETGTQTRVYTWPRHQARQQGEAGLMLHVASHHKKVSWSCLNHFISCDPSIIYTWAHSLTKYHFLWKYTLSLSTTILCQDVLSRVHSMAVFACLHSVLCIPLSSVCAANTNPAAPACVWPHWLTNASGLELTNINIVI